MVDKSIPFWQKYSGTYCCASLETKKIVFDLEHETVFLNQQAIFFDDDIEDFVLLSPVNTSISFEIPLEFQFRNGHLEPVLLTVAFVHLEGTKNAVLHISSSVNGVIYEAKHQPDFEAAMLQLRLAWKDVGVLRCCESCAWSDYERGTSRGHMMCALAHKETYRQSARGTARERQGLTCLSGEWVDELAVCAEFEERPENWGYRG
jgi:hypothetical protein